MNIHPIIVHFPIALLTLYSLLEIVGLFGRERPKKLQQTKLFLLFIGTVGTFFALQSGELSADILGMGESRLIETHESFAGNSYTTYVILAIYYLLVWIRTTNIFSLLPTSLATALQNLYQKAQKNTAFQIVQKRILGILDRTYIGYIVILGAIIGLVLLSITGALGGAISHGPDVDPIVQIIYNIFVGK